MDYEKYKNALEKAKARYNEIKDTDCSEKKFLLDLFPELKESEDEKIRKALIDYFDDANKADVNPLQSYGTNTNKVIAWLEKQGEKKPIDKSEPKFKVGDWIVDNCNNVWQVVEVSNNFYRLKNINESESLPKIKWVNETFHLWSVKDAKDGDLLATSAGAFIYNGNNDGGSCSGCYCGIDTLGNFRIGVEYHWTEKPVFPATKEQRDLLFKKMKEEGYEWDADKKELKNIEQNHVTYEMILEYAAKRFLDTLSHSPYNNRPVVDAQVVTEELLKFLANPSDYNPDVINMVKSGHAWNVEDSSKVQRICQYLNEAKKYYADITEVRECMDWLKSIEDRVQPKPTDWSDEDEEKLQNCCGAIGAADYYTYDDKQEMEKWLLQLKERLS